MKIFIFGKIVFAHCSVLGRLRLGRQVMLLGVSLVLGMIYDHILDCDDSSQLRTWDYTSGLARGAQAL